MARAVHLEGGGHSREAKTACGKSIYRVDQSVGVGYIRRRTPPADRKVPLTVTKDFEAVTCSACKQSYEYLRYVRGKREEERRREADELASRRTETYTLTVEVAVSAVDLADARQQAWDIFRRLGREVMVRIEDVTHDRTDGGAMHMEEVTPKRFGPAGLD